MDQTRGILTYVEQNCPGRFHSSIEYVTVAGKYIQGAGLRDQGASIAQKVVGAGYQQAGPCPFLGLHAVHFAFQRHQHFAEQSICGSM